MSGLDARMTRSAANDNSVGGGSDAKPRIRFGNFAFLGLIIDCSFDGFAAAEERKRIQEEIPHDGRTITLVPDWQSFVRRRPTEGRLDSSLHINTINVRSPSQVLYCSSRAKSGFDEVLIGNA